jgi:hypothetical protein
MEQGGVPVLFYASAGATIPPMLLQPPYEELTDEEIVAVLREVIAGAGRPPRHVDVYLAGLCAKHL